ncbi:endoproteinase ArgC [Diaphorobacter sp. HDW4A]|uniref:trypsin-like serine peptidase n=1 Tax=Diaphorobacter sp. HDW4A TaxID=2714924 RepID=UPI00140E874A|nr:trypsin-like peptidase domain-containing protein [Diaphorobacter sp. HDW4A]QIL81950.1 endoproteinase ArgC [Diaphorobacter sp. HDW4A]
MRKHSKAWWLAGSVALVIAGCGGGSGGSDSGTGSGTGTTDPGTTTPPQPNLAERIEPYDTVTKSAEATAKSTAVVRGAAASQAIANVSLSAPVSTLKQSTLATAVSAKPGAPIQIGVQRDVSATATVAATTALLTWKNTESGTRVAAIAFESPTAQGVRLGVQVQQLPASAVLRFYGAAGAEATEVTAAELQAQAEQLRNSGADAATARTYWSPEFGGTKTILEVEIGATADAAQVQIAVPSLSHFTFSAAEMQKSILEKAASGSCNIDVMCQPDYLQQGRSVARMIYVSGAASYYCTGTLINDAKSSGTPYFLTANHCISTQAEASSLITDWFYTASACNSGTVSTNTRRLNKGASLLYATASTDTSFLQLNEAPPSGVVYAGSYYGAALASSNGIAGVHHPAGDLQKMSIGTVKGLGQCSNETCIDSSDSNNGFYAINWQQGTTEGGSSGSALFYTIGSSRYVTGTLYGGTASCQTPNGSDYYGRFDVPYKAKLKAWLNP